MNLSDTPAAKPQRLISLYTDGACRGNPGPGGWAYILRDSVTLQEREGSGGEPDTTNNRMELMAVIAGLSALTRPCRVDLHSDSKYVLQGLESWMHSWKKNNWRRRTSAGTQPVKNDDLWKRLDQLISYHEVKFIHVRGHSGHLENERCDQLAVAAAEAIMRGR